MAPFTPFLRIASALVAASLIISVGCATSEDGRESASSSATASTSTTATATATATTEETASGSESESQGSSATTSASGTSEGTSEGTTSTSTSASTSTSTSASTSASTSDSSPDLGVDTGCSPDDFCCDREGFIPPHQLLDAFLAAYPAAAMPMTHDDVDKFDPMVDGHVMAWSDVNANEEFVDAKVGGLTEANLSAGRELSRAAAESAVPVDAVVLEVREDPPEILDLGTPPPCNGVGWAWGSILFENADESIGEVVYLYVGFCSNGDIERFLYSDQAVEVCPAPG
ncbi:MAG: hypothetical protein R3B09_30115 [Nannocystaceae bacterium]